ncbi:MAG: hypothetical protein R2810_04200 [Flavobacteriales bacterium]
MRSRATKRITSQPTLREADVFPSCCLLVNRHLLFDLLAASSLEVLRPI